MHGPLPLNFCTFAPASFSPAGNGGNSSQVQYLRSYLCDLKARSYIEEPYYFDRDYLAEFATFYSTSARGYENHCRRLTLFTLAKSDLVATFRRALAGESDAAAQLQDSFLGFIVVRPIGATPLGRTVLSWYPDGNAELPRVITPSRDYFVHLAGLELKVHGLAWQEQDTAVGACATIALWAMFHSSARDEHHAIPTTADVTEAANRRWPLAHRAFPAQDGMSTYQMCEAIRAQGLQPAFLDGDVTRTLDEGEDTAFSVQRFVAASAAFIRSGFPVLLAGRCVPRADLTKSGTGHAVCAVGFRTGKASAVGPKDTREEDANIQYVYLHDDNLGPSVRFRIRPEANEYGAKFVALVPEAPEREGECSELEDPTATADAFIPQSLLVALPDEIRLSVDDLNRRALKLASKVSVLLTAVYNRKSGGDADGVTFSSRFMRVASYLGTELSGRRSADALHDARLGLTQQVPPMSLHVAVIRIASNSDPLMDVLLDTTDSQPGTAAFAHVVFTPKIGRLLKQLERGGEDLGTRVDAF